MKTLSIYSLNNFPICYTVVFAMIIVLCITIP